MNGVGERRYAIYLLVGEVFRVKAGPKVTANELLRKIDVYCGITFKEESAKYLQLAFVDQNDQVCWLRGDRAVLDYDFPHNFLRSDAEVPIHHLFRFYPNPLHVRDHKILVFLYLDSRQQFLKGDVELDLLKYAKCCACLILLSLSTGLSEQNIVDAFQLQISPPMTLLKRFDVSVDDIQKQIVKEYNALQQSTQAELILDFLLLLETSSFMHGSFFYEVSEKSGQKCKLAVNGKWLVQFNADDLHKPKSSNLIAFEMLSWQHVENVHCSEKQLTLVINANKSQSPSKSCDMWETASNSSGSPLRIKRPVQDENREWSDSAETIISRQLSSPSRAPQRIVYNCESASLCKTIWEVVIAQHQNYLDQRTCKKVFAPAEIQRRKEEQCERLEQHLAAVGSVCSTPSSPHLSCSIPSSSSLESFASCSAGMPSAKVADGNYCRNIQAIQNCDKKLNEQRIELEDRLLQKLLDLKAVCIREGEITGKIPNEIYKTLLPEEDLPVVKKRIGTTFKFSDDVLQQAHLDGDRQAQLAIDIELHRKIVAAAERLAKDKSTNKSVRKKRRKDWQAASQKLKGLEKGLYKLRVSNSKPDNLNYFETASMSNAGSGFSLNSLKGWSNFSISLKSATKSCPTTPRGSVPDLLMADDVCKAFKKKLSSSSSNGKRSETELLANTSSYSSMAKHPSSTSNSSLAQPSMERSSVNSKSSTGLDSLPPSIPSRRRRVQEDGIPLSRDTPLYANNNCLSKRLLTYTENNCLQSSSSPPNSSVVCTRFSAQKAEGCKSHLVVSNTSLLDTANCHLGNIVRKMSESVSTPCSSASSSSTASSGYISNGGAAVAFRTSPTNQTIWLRTSMRGKPFSLNGHMMDKKSNSSGQHSNMITTFPVNDICRPLQPGDFSKYRSISAVRNDSNSKKLTGASASASRNSALKH
uniref:FERM domain-containing protein n=1 Tax=Ditylenchus dipsaci TaxID=166011 RepID=A0A915E497_9BILA